VFVRRRKGGDACCGTRLVARTSNASALSGDLVSQGGRDARKAYFLGGHSGRDCQFRNCPLRSRPRQRRSDAAWLKAKCTPHPLQTYETRLTLKNPIGNGLPATYVAVKPDYGPTVAVREYVKTRKEWNYVELEAAHDAMVDQPQAVIDIISGL
jgi:hypothetical protein